MISEPYGHFLMPVGVIGCGRVSGHGVISDQQTIWTFSNECWSDWQLCGRVSGHGVISDWISHSRWVI